MKVTLTSVNISLETCVPQPESGHFYNCPKRPFTC